jgi:hypothetical protein
MKLHFKYLFGIAMIGGLLFIAVMFSAGGRFRCVGSQYETYDFFKDGVLQELIHDGSPTLSIMDQK